MNTSTNARPLEPFTICNPEGVESTNWRVFRAASDEAHRLAQQNPGTQYTVRDRVSKIVDTALVTPAPAADPVAWDLAKASA